VFFFLCQTLGIPYPLSLGSKIKGIPNGNLVQVLSEWLKGDLRPSNAKRLYMDEKSTEIGEVT